MSAVSLVSENIKLRETVQRLLSPFWRERIRESEKFSDLPKVTVVDLGQNFKYFDLIF